MCPTLCCRPSFKILKGGIAAKVGHKRLAAVFRALGPEPSEPPELALGNARFDVLLIGTGYKLGSIILSEG